jgi:hypothetical protein
MNKIFMTTASIILIVILIITFSCVSNKNKTEKELSLFIDRNISHVSSEVNNTLSLVQERVSSVESKYIQLAQKLEEVPELEERVNNDAIVNMFKDSFSLVSYIGQQEKFIKQEGRYF